MARYQMNSFIPDKFATSLRLAVKITEGVCTLEDGSPLPKMKSGASAELLISPWDITDDAARNFLLNERRVEFLPSGTSLWARVKEDNVSDDLKRLGQHRNAWPNNPGFFVEIGVTAPLTLVVRGDGRAALGDCACKIPSLRGKDCSSVNEAYTRVSEAFEPSRRSHTGNIFNCVYYELGNHLHPLRKLRDEKISASSTSSQASK